MTHAPNYPKPDYHYQNDYDQAGQEHEPMYHQNDYSGDAHQDYYHHDHTQGHGYDQHHDFSDQGYGHHGDGQYHQDYQGFDQGHAHQGADGLQGQAHHGGDQGLSNTGPQGHHGGDGQYQSLSNQGGAQQGGQGQYQGLANQGGAHQGGAQGQFQGAPDQTGAQITGHQNVGQGFQNTNTQGFSGQGQSGPFQNTTAQPTSGPGGATGYQNVLPGNQPSIPNNPVQTLGGGQPATQPLGVLGGSGPVPPAGPIPPPLVNRPKTNSLTRPESTAYYSVLMPVSPTTTNHSADLSHIQEALETQAPVETTVNPVDSLAQDLGYSPQSKKVLLDQTRYHDATSSQHTSSRVLTSPRIATVPSMQPPEVRAPQERHSELVGSIVSTGNVSSLNTFDRRHPQSHEGESARDSLFYDYPSVARAPQDG